MSAASQRRLPNVVISASAGSGKTHQLSNRLIRLLAGGTPGDQTLAVTFTRKAAGEILDRILLRVAEAAADPQAAGRLAEQLGNSQLTQQRFSEVLFEATRNLHRLNVSTLDSFFARIAGSFSLELGLPPGWRIVEQIDDETLRDEAIQVVLQNDSAADLLTLMHLLTKGEARRGVSELIRETVNELYALYREAPAESWTALKQPKPLPPDKLFAAIESLREAEAPENKNFRKAIDKDYQSALEGDWDKFAAGGLAGKVSSGDSKYYNKPIPEPLVEAYGKLLQHAKAVLVGQAARQTEATFKLLEKFDAAYTRLKNERRALRFDDVTHRLVGAAELAQSGEIAFRLDASARHVLLDEFQDTSLDQWRVVRPFAQRAAAESGASFFCVGDVKQAIYGWRGGSARILGALGAELENLQSEDLNVSYRSAPPIMEAVNRVFQGLTNHPNLEKYQSAVAAWQNDFVEHSTVRQELAGYACLETAPAAGENEAAQNAVFDCAAARVQAIAEQAPAATVGVLVRTNDAVGRLIYRLRKLGIAASEEGGNPLNDSPAVEIVLSLLRLADHPGDTASRFHVANSPLADVHQLQDHTNHAAAIAAAREIRRRLLEQGYGPVVGQWAKALAPSCDERDMNRLQQLVELAYLYQSRATLRTGDFVAFVEQQRVADPSSAKVRAMTVHQAKGLQFDVVVAPELDKPLVGQTPGFVVGRPSPTEPVDAICRYLSESVQQMLPERFKKMFADDVARRMSESLCVLYVTLTRPVHALHMIVAPSTKSEKNPPKTFAGLVRAALTDGAPLAPDTIAYETGDSRWFANTPDVLIAPAALPDDTATCTQIELAPPAGGALRGTERIAPSSLEVGPKVRLSEVMDSSRDAAMQRGTLVHAWFELVDWLDPAQPNDGRPDKDSLLGAAIRLGVDQSGIDAELARFDKLLAQPRIARVLSREEYAKPGELSLPSNVAAELKSGPLEFDVRPELHFALRQPDGLLEGYIDRLALIRRGGKLLAADILDFKTDRLIADDSTQLAAKVDRYRAQLDAYRRAVMHIFNLPRERVTARLVFVEVGEVCSVQRQ